MLTEKRFFPTNAGGTGSATMKHVLLTICLAGATACAAMTGSKTSLDLPPSAQGTVVDVAAKDGRFNTLVAALKAAGLVEALAAEGPFTVFAPTDDAFAALPAGTVENLLKPESKDQLIRLLKHHVVTGNVTGEDLAGLIEAATLGGTTFAIEAADGNVAVGGSKIVAADVGATNGVIHVVEKVMMPADI